MTLLGQVKNGVVVFENGAAAPLPDGTLVQVTPLKVGSGSVVVAAMEAAPNVSPEDADEMEKAIAAGQRPAARIDPFADALPVSKERREALLGLIGMWKVENPPSDEEVERIIEEERMKKYG